MDAVAKESLPYSEWSKVRFGDCYNDDALWGFAIATSREQFLRQMDPREDEVLKTLIDMGVFNWEDPDVEGHESRWSMRHSSAMASHLLKRIETLETKVRVVVNGRCCPSNHYSFVEYRP